MEDGGCSDRMFVAEYSGSDQRGALVHPWNPQRSNRLVAGRSTVGEWRSEVVAGGADEPRRAGGAVQVDRERSGASVGEFGLFDVRPDGVDDAAIGREADHVGADRPGHVGAGVVRDGPDDLVAGVVDLGDSDRKERPGDGLSVDAEAELEAESAMS